MRNGATSKWQICGQQQPNRGCKNKKYWITTKAWKKKSDFAHLINWKPFWRFGNSELMEFRSRWCAASGGGWWVRFCGRAHDGKTTPHKTVVYWWRHIYSGSVLVYARQFNIRRYIDSVSKIKKISYFWFILDWLALGHRITSQRWIKIIFKVYKTIFDSTQCYGRFAATLNWDTSIGCAELLFVFLFFIRRWFFFLLLV